MKRGEICWYTFHRPDKCRPVLILTRDEIVEQLNESIVAPVTRTIRGLTSSDLLLVVSGAVQEARGGTQPPYDEEG